MRRHVRGGVHNDCDAVQGAAPPTQVRYNSAIRIAITSVRTSFTSSGLTSSSRSARASSNVSRAGCNCSMVRLRHGAVVLGYTACFGLMNPVLPYHTRDVIARDHADPASWLARSGLSTLFAYSAVLAAYSGAKLALLPLVSAAADRSAMK